jgi:pimeloyl-ACP methyl ester carboxylesterase
MVPTVLSEDVHHRIPNSTLTIYPNSGHAGVFQHGWHFNTEVLRHLS